MKKFATSICLLILAMQSNASAEASRLALRSCAGTIKNVVAAASETAPANFNLWNVQILSSKDVPMRKNQEEVQIIERYEMRFRANESTQSPAKARTGIAKVRYVVSTVGGDDDGMCFVDGLSLN